MLKKRGMLKKGEKTQLFRKSLKKRGKTEIVNKKHKNDIITSKKGTF